MSLHAAEIAAVVRELAPLTGSRVDAVRVHSERALTLELYGRAGPATLLLSAEADRTRLHAATTRPPQPRSPLALQALLRKELEGAQLASLSALPGERVVELGFTRREEGPVSLVAELTGRHGNLFLLGPDRVIRATAGRNLSSRRDLVPGQPYQAPAPRPPGAAPEGVETSRFSPVEGAAFPLSAAIESHYAALEEERRLADERRRLRDPLRAGLARLRRALEKIEEEAARVPAAEADRRTADLLKQNLHLLRRGAREAVLTEWTEEGPREVRVALDPTLSPHENMARAYRRYRRIVESAERVAARAAEVRGRASELSRLLAEVGTADLPALARVEAHARRLGAAPRVQAAERPARRRKQEEAAPPYRSFRSASGALLMVGRNAEGNDALTVRVAKGNDLWLHARGITGAHVVVRFEKGRPPDGETLLDAAHLAAWFSDARGEPAVEVAYTRAKFVRKPKGSAPGAVLYSQERTLMLRVETGRVERLLANEEA